MWDHDGDNRLNQEEFTDMLRSLDVDVDDSVKGRQSLISIAKAVGVSSPLVTFEQVINSTPSHTQ
jgi:Ca2+-binding EF-hand superfamily protein